MATPGGHECCLTVMQAKVAWAEAQSRSNDASRYSAAQWRSLGAWWKAEVLLVP